MHDVNQQWNGTLVLYEVDWTDYGYDGPGLVSHANDDQVASVYLEDGIMLPPFEHGDGLPEPPEGRSPYLDQRDASYVYGDNHS